MLRKLLTSALAIVLFIVTTHRVHATSMAPYAKLSELAGAWVGQGKKGEYFRLELNEKGIGLLVVRELFDEDISIYRVTGTKLEGYSVSFALQSVGEAEPVTFSGSTAGYDMRLVRQGIGEAHWSSEVELEPEDVLLDKLKSVRKASARFRSANKI